MVAIGRICNALWFLLKVRHVIAPPGSLRERVLRRIRWLAVGSRGPVMANVPAFEGASRFPLQASGSKYDVFCLPVIEWEFRFQRPQQLMRQFARNGHRVFYVSHRFISGTTPKWRVLEEGIAEISLSGDEGNNIYTHQPTETDVRRAIDSIDYLRRSASVDAAVTVVQLPAWRSLAEQMRSRYGWQIIYDCMDEHSGFSTNTAGMVAEEERLLAESDLTLASSTILYEKAIKKSSPVSLVRNATDYEHFSNALQLTAVDGAIANRVVGYYGAIAEWFDVDLVAELARLHPDWRFQLIGHVHNVDISSLNALPNVVSSSASVVTMICRR